MVVDHAGEGAPGLWSVVGGKLTTHRTLAEQLVSRALVRLQRPWTRCLTRRGTLHLEGLLREVTSTAEGLPLDPAQIEHLVTLYGPRAKEVVDRVRQDPSGAARICPHNPDIAAQVGVAVEREWAVTLADLLLRRTGIGTSACLGLDCAEHAAGLMGRAAGWDNDRQAREVAAYRQLMECRHRAGLERK
jgi:glycerol-3-phosphate dehydrogenase